MDGESIRSLEGTYKIPEFSNDVLENDEEWEIVCTHEKGDKELWRIMENMVKNLAPIELRKVLKTKFVEELKKK